MYPILALNKPVFSAIVMTSTKSSGGTFIGECNHYSVQSVWTGTSPIGNLLTQASNDNINWTTIDTLALTGNSGTYIYNSPLAGYAYVQITYTFTSGTGSLTSTLCGKAN